MKTNLNGHYCLATQEHYDKLVEDGYTLHEFSTIDFKIHDRFNVYDEEFRPVHKKNEYAHGTREPMHLHNNEWVLGSLEHDEVPEAFCTKCGKTYKEHYFIKDYPYCNEPKQVQRITREEAKADVRASILSEWELTFEQSANDALQAMEQIIDNIYDSLEVN